MLSEKEALDGLRAAREAGWYGGVFWPRDIGDWWGWYCHLYRDVEVIYERGDDPLDAIERALGRIG